MLAVVLVRSVYASQRPSGENSEFKGANDSTAPNRSTFLSGRDSVHSDAPRDVVALNDSRGAAWRPRLGDVRDVLVRRGQPFNGARAVSTLPVHTQRAVTIRLKGDSPAIRRPDREAVSTAKRQPPG